MKLAVQLAGITLLVALLYDGWIFYSRRRDAGQTARALAGDEAAKDAALAKFKVGILGDGQLKITSFYASPGIVKKATAATICYGVTGAKTLRLDPPAEPVWPALAHCLQVTPARDTEYKLTARDEAGHEVSASFVLRVAR